MRALDKAIAIAATLLTTTALAAETEDSADEPPIDRASIEAAFDLAPPAEVEEDAPAADADAARKRFAQLERAAAEATTIHALGRVATAAETLGYGEPAFRGQAFRLAAWGYVSRGRLRAAAGRNKAALEDFDRAVELTPNAAEPRLERAVSLAEQGDDRAALEELNAVVEAAPELVVVRLNRAAVLLRLGASESALADCDAVLDSAKRNDFVRLLELKGRAQQQLGRLDQAAQTAARGLAESATDAALLILRGDLSAERGLDEQAIDDYLAAVESDSENPDAYRRLAWLLATTPVARLRNPQTAIEAARRARRLGGEDDPLTLDASAAAYAAAGDFSEAIRFQQRAILAAGDDAASGMRDRLALYRGDRVFIASSDASGAGAARVEQATYQSGADGE